MVAAMSLNSRGHQKFEMRRAIAREVLVRAPNAPFSISNIPTIKMHCNLISENDGPSRPLIKHEPYSGRSSSIPICLLTASNATMTHDTLLALLSRKPPSAPSQH